MFCYRVIAPPLDDSVYVMCEVPVGTLQEGGVFAFPQAACVVVSPAHRPTVLDRFDYAFPENGLTAFQLGKPLGVKVRLFCT